MSFRKVLASIFLKIIKKLKSLMRLPKKKLRRLAINVPEEVAPIRAKSRMLLHYLMRPKLC